jgi:NADH dehydrogenase/NADH:ubiquinone oxidoreductase subunit G
MPKCTINGREIEVPAGTTVIQALPPARAAP